MPPLTVPSATPGNPSDGTPMTTTVVQPKATSGIAHHRIQRPSKSPATIAVGITGSSGMQFRVALIRTKRGLMSPELPGALAQLRDL